LITTTKKNNDILITAPNADEYIAESPFEKERIIEVLKTVFLNHS